MAADLGIVHVPQAMEVEPEPPDPLTAWFRAHFVLLEVRGTLVTQLDGAGPEVGVLPQHAPPPIRRSPPSAEPMRRKQRRRYDVNEGRCAILLSGCQCCCPYGISLHRGRPCARAGACRPTVYGCPCRFVEDCLWIRVPPIVSCYLQVHG